MKERIYIEYFTWKFPKMFRTVSYRKYLMAASTWTAALT